MSQCTVGSITWATCGSLSVLENPARPTGPRISIRVVVLPAYGSKRAADPLFYFQGGPGGAASDPVNVEWAAHAFVALNAGRDIVFVDQRGTGGSNAMECPALMNLGSRESGAMPSPSEVASAAKACLTSIGNAGDPAMYTTPLFADDVDQVRAALGYQSIDLYGASYGVSSALDYIQRHGAHVRSAVLDSGSLLDYRLWERSAAPLEASLQSVLNRCVADSTCHSSYPTITTELATVVAGLNAAPVSVSAVDPTSGKTVTVTVDVNAFSAALQSLLDNVSDMAEVPAFIHTASLGAWAQLVKAYLASQPTDNPQATYVMARSIECSDAWARMDPAAVQAEGGSSLFTPSIVEQAKLQQEFCAAWPAATGASGPVRTSAPVVFLNGTADYTDPPANVAGAAATMPNSLVVPVQGYGHGQLAQDTSGCLDREATAFVEAGVPSKATNWPCAHDPPFPPFNLG